jgi:NAD(P)H-hydrate epimerase
MIPVVTPAEMAAIDAAAPEPQEVLIERAGAAVARGALQMLGGAYGRSVVVVAGKGNNGNDGRVAARRLADQGVAVQVIGPGEALPSRPRSRPDLVIDAAFGTGFVDRGEWHPAKVGDVPVLAVDIPSGVNGLTGEAVPGVPVCHRTVTFAALKPGLLLEPGRTLAGRVEVVDIGLDCSSARAWWVGAGDAASWLPARAPTAHKWQAACWVIAGSGGMTGAAHLAARGAQRAGAGYVRLSSPGVTEDYGRPTEAVGVPLRIDGWDHDVRAEAQRFQSLVVGPGLGRSKPQLAAVGQVAAALDRPLVVDGDGLAGLARPPAAGWPAERVLTPHDGEYRLLTGEPPGADRFAAARALAADMQAFVLLKGPTTLVAGPDGQVLVVTEGDPRLATAGTGDVLSGIIGALLAQGVRPAQAAALGAFLHGRAAQRGPVRGLVAGDLPDLVPVVIGRLLALQGAPDRRAGPIDPDEPDDEPEERGR